MADSQADSARQFAAKEIEARRDRLIAERASLAEMRADLLMRQRRNDRELADCRAAARFFDLNIEFPADDDSERERALLARREAELRIARERDFEIRARGDLVAHRPIVSAHTTITSTPHVARPTVAPSAGAEVTTPPPPLLPRPPIKDIAIEQLSLAGRSGLKAAAIREYAERKYGLVMHEKTVGMTLYRLLKENLVHRDGHTWFFGPASVPETKDPGGETPGPNNVFG